MKDDDPRLSAATLKVLGAFIRDPSRQLSGADLAREANIGPGTLYPLLQRLERAKWLDSRWETENPADLGRPRRRYYWITGLGMQRARSAYKEMVTAFGAPAWGI